MGTKLNKKAFSTVEVLIVILVILVLGLGGWYVYKHNHKKATKVTSTTTSSNMNNMNMSTSTYAGWKTYTSPNEKSSFMYPSNWTISVQNLTSAQNDSVGSTDIVTLLSPNGTTVEYNANSTGLINGPFGLCFADSPTLFVQESTKIPNVALYLIKLKNNQDQVIGMGLNYKNLNIGDGYCGVFSYIEDINLNEDGDSALPGRGTFMAFVKSNISQTPINSKDISIVENILSSYTY